jgi:hypothetical protein
MTLPLVRPGRLFYPARARLGTGHHIMTTATRPGSNSPAGQTDVQRAFQTIEATLQAEDWFFETIRTALARKAPLGDFETVTGPNGHDYLLHFTQFLFFLEALDCQDAHGIAAFIDGHNARLDAMLADPGFGKSAKEYERALFGPRRRATVCDTVRTLGQPVFAIYEWGHLLIDAMSPKTTEKLIEDLRHGGLLVRKTDPRIDADGKRVLIASTGFLERTYRDSLLVLRRMIAASLDEDEWRGGRARQISEGATGSVVG